MLQKENSSLSLRNGETGVFEKIFLRDTENQDGRSGEKENEGQNFRGLYILVINVDLFYRQWQTSVSSVAG